MPKFIKMLFLSNPFDKKNRPSRSQGIFPRIKASGAKIAEHLRILCARTPKKLPLAQVQAKIIALEAEKMTGEQAERYAPRKKYVQNILIPQLVDLGISASIWNGIVPKDIHQFEGEFCFRGKKFTWGRDRQGILADPYQVCLALGHMMIWEECIKTEKPTLVLEDDAFLESKNQNLIARTISEFQFLPPSLSQASILYLQSTCPWRPGKCLKSYPPSSLLKVDRRFFGISEEWKDVSGTAAYFINPQTAVILLKYFSRSPLWNIDGMFDDLKTKGIIKILVPKKYKNNFKLHPELS